MYMYYKVLKRFKWEKKFDVVFYGKINGYLCYFIFYFFKIIFCVEFSY